MERGRLDLGIKGTRTLGDNDASVKKNQLKTQINYLEEWKLRIKGFEFGNMCISLMRSERSNPEGELHYSPQSIF